MNFFEEKLALGQAILAPMAGYTDAPFRLLCREFGSAWAVTEMVSAKGLVKGDLKGIEIGEPYKGEPDLVIQVFGGEPELVAEGGRLLYKMYQPRALDLNMGCPVKKITGKSCGSKLMLEPERAAAIIRHLSQAVPIPVSAKMRLGYDTVNVREVAAAVAEAGASVVAIHGRTAAEKYTGEANWEVIKDVADHLPVPVIGSGDVATKEAFERYRSWGLGVMVARAAVGRPWIFSDLRGARPLTMNATARVAYRHAQLHCNWYAGDAESERRMMMRFRAQLLKYFAALPGGRSELVRISSLADLRAFIFNYLELDLADYQTTDLTRTLTKARRKQRRKRLTELSLAG